MKGTVKEISMERCGTAIIEVEDCSDLDIEGILMDDTKDVQSLTLGWVVLANNNRDWRNSYCTNPLLVSPQCVWKRKWWSCHCNLQQ